MRTTVALVAVLLAAAGCSRLPEPAPALVAAPSPFDLPVESWRDVDCAEINEILAAAAAEGRDWSKSPIRTLLVAVGGDLEMTLVELVAQGNRGESPDTMSVEIARDGFMDDSVRGDRHEAVMYRLEDWTWRLHSLRVAYRCQRGTSLHSYSADFCP